MATIASLNVLLSAQTAPLARGFKSAETMATGFGSRMRGLGSAIGAGLNFALGPLGLLIGGIALLGKSFQLATVQEQAVKKLEGVLAATGNAAGFSSTELQKMASDLQSVTNFGDEVTISAMGILATFKEIRGDVFQEAIASAQDMSSVMGQDLKSSVTQVGKALNDPTKGLAALSRVGVSFTQQQKDMVKQLQQSGDTLGAQRVILDELKGEFGGAATAMVDPFTQFKNSLGDALEFVGGIAKSIGGVFLTIGTPILNGISSALAAIAGPVEAIMSFVSNTIGAGIDAAIGFVAPIWNGFTSFLVSSITAVVDYLSPVFISMSGVASSAFNAMLGMAQALWAGLTSVFNSVAETIGAALNYVGINMESTGNFGRWMMETIQAALLVLEFAFTRWKDLASFALLSVGLGVVSFVNSTIHFFTVALPGYLSWFANHWREVFTDILNVTSTIFSNIGKNIVSLWEGIKSFFSGDGFTFEWTPLTEGFKSAITELPKIAEREMGPLEKDLSAQVAALGNNIQKDFEAFANERTQQIADDTTAFRDRLEGGLGAFLPAEATAGAAFASPASQQLNAGAGEQAKVGALVRGSAEAFKAAQGGNSMDRLAKTAQEQLKEQRAQTGLLEDIAGAEEEAVEIP